MGGRDLWVVRKGATPAFPGQRGFSLAARWADDGRDPRGVSIVRRPGHRLYSTVHGAGETLRPQGSQAGVLEPCRDGSMAAGARRNAGRRRSG